MKEEKINMKKNMNKRWKPERKKIWWKRKK